MPVWKNRHISLVLGVRLYVHWLCQLRFTVQNCGFRHTNKLEAGLSSILQILVMDTGHLLE